MKVLLFGIAREITGATELEIPAQKTVHELKTWLGKQYPQLGALKSIAIAIDREYANDDQVLPGDSEIALIPPVSGG